jgi:ribonuclease P protein component
VASKGRLVVLKNRSDFLKIQKDGQRVRLGGWLILNFRPNDLGIIRCGWTLPRKTGNAVIRNKLKRWLRVYFRDRLAITEPIGIDVNVVLLKSGDDFYKNLDYEEFSKHLDKAWTLLRKRA